MMNKQIEVAGKVVELTVVKEPLTHMTVLETLLRLEKAEFELYIIRASLRARLTPAQKMELNDGYEKQAAARYTPEGNYKEGI